MAASFYDPSGGRRIAFGRKATTGNGEENFLPDLSGETLMLLALAASLWIDLSPGPGATTHNRKIDLGQLFVDSRVSGLKKGAGQPGTGLAWL
jgi:hypothetical protein